MRLVKVMLFGGTFYMATPADGASSNEPRCVGMLALGNLVALLAVAATIQAGSFYHSAFFPFLASKYCI